VKTITFQTEINGEQVIRPPSGVVLPSGRLEVTVKTVEPKSGSGAADRAAANARLRACRESTGRSTGIDNEGIDADLAREYQKELE
jgi:hypothetical protein